jgi:uncharacterized protein YbjT (DUF2867 family)
MNDRAIPPLTGKVVTVLGGSGFVGRHLAQELLARGARLRIASRNPEKAYRVKPLGNLGQVAFTRVDVTRPETLGAALAGTDAVVYLVGAFSGNLDALQGKGVGKVAAAAKQAGVQSFVHISALGCDAQSPVAYARTKAEGEQAVFAAFPEATILRPSLLFGPDDQFIQMFAGLISGMPVLPVFAPEARMQPLFVDDLAEAVGNAVAVPDMAAGKIFELAGPETVSMIELHRRIANAQARNRSFIELPDAVGSGLATVMGFLPGGPISSDQYTLLKAGSVASGKLPGITDLGVHPRPLELFLDRWMVSYRKHGRFSDATPAQ